MEPSPLVYDTAAAAAVWQRVGPALPAYDAAPCPVGACCPLPRRETDSEAMLGGLIAEGAALYACCRRCAVRAPRQSRQALEQLATVADGEQTDMDDFLKALQGGGEE